MTESESITIVPAESADVPVILSFICKLAEYEKLLHEIRATEEMLRQQLFGSRPGAEVLIAKLGAKPVGFALYFPTFSTFEGTVGLWLEDLFVLEEFRGRGIGRRLISRVASTAVQRKCARLEWSVLDWNESAIQFYRKIGAQPMSDWTTQRLVGEPLKRLAQE